MWPCQEWRATGWSGYGTTLAYLIDRPQYRTGLVGSTCEGGTEELPTRERRSVMWREEFV